MTEAEKYQSTYLSKVGPSDVDRRGQRRCPVLAEPHDDVVRTLHSQNSIRWQ